LSDPEKKREWEDYRKYGGRTNVNFNDFRPNFRSNFDPFEMFREFFGGRDPFGDDDDFFGKMHMGMGMGGGFSSSAFSSSSMGGGMGLGSSGITKSVKKTTQIM
jgi:hypothetical protein